jgi:hypothetical protein
MGIENWHLNHNSENPAYRSLERLRDWCKKIGLSPNTVKVITGIRKVPEVTALGKLMGISPDLSILTRQEITLIKNKKFPASTLLIIDIDGVLVSIWPTLSDFWKRWKAAPTFSPSQIWEKIEESIVETRPSPFFLLPLSRMAKIVDQIIFWTHRFPTDKKSTPFSPIRQQLN